jgi:beta-1,4-mannosyl-glycoprotein beta-1,4-N-acetylglucosaminyltransferase
MEDVFMIYDGFMFYRDFEILDIRLNELNDVVDKFVLVECTKTFRGKDKPLYFNENKHLYMDHLDKIIHVIADDPPEVNVDGRKHERQFSDFSIELYQRDCIMRGLVNCEDEDIILISDADEIPRKELIRNISFNNVYFYTCYQRLYYYYLNTYFNTIWAGTNALKYRHLKVKGPNRFRKLRRRGTPWNNGGWHFSHLVGNRNDAIEKIQEKMRISGHYELDTPDRNNSNNLQKCLTELRGYHRYSGCSAVMNIDTMSFMPTHVQENKERFEDYIYGNI